VSRRADRPRTIADIPTPALVVDVPAMERNIRRMAEFFAEGETVIDVWPVSARGYAEQRGQGA
jgi:D-serine deaminase-like pyridoxal phosphate-dependent protein